MVENKNLNIETRKRMFELIDKLFVKNEDNKSFINHILTGDIFNGKKATITIDELKELIGILIHKNPYINQSNDVAIEYKKDIKITGGVSKAEMEYSLFDDTISITDNYLSNIRKKPIKFTEVVASVGHELRHRFQYVNHQDDLTLEHFGDISRELMVGHFDIDEIEEINKFIAENNLDEKKLSKLQVLRCQFGAYLNNTCEIDARNSEEEYVKATFAGMMNDEFCSEELKNKLVKSLAKYKVETAKFNELATQRMEQYKLLRQRLKDIFKKMLKTDVSKLSQDKHIHLLTKTMTQISKEMTPEEKVEFMDWSLENNYIELIQNISFDAHGKDKTAVSTFISESFKNKKIGDENAITLFAVQCMQYKNPEDIKQVSTDYVKCLINNDLYYSTSHILREFKQVVDVEEIAKSIVDHSQTLIENEKELEKIDRTGLEVLLYNLISNQKDLITKETMFKINPILIKLQNYRINEDSL